MGNYLDRGDLNKEIERLRRDCGELYQVIGVLADAIPLRNLRASGIRKSDIIRALDNAHDASEGNPRRHDDLVPWPKNIGTGYDRGQYTHSANNRNKKATWLPDGVNVTYKLKHEYSIQLAFKVNWVKDGETYVTWFYAGIIGSEKLTESKAILTQNAAIQFRTEFKEALLSGTHFDYASWFYGKWRNKKIARTPISPPKPYTSVKSLDDLLVA